MGRTEIPDLIQVDSITSLSTLMKAFSSEAAKGKELTAQGFSYRVDSPADFGMELSGTEGLMNALKTLPTTVIFTAHLVNRYGKAPGKEYGENIVIGEQILGRDKNAETVVSRFDNVFRFDRREINGQMLYFVSFSTDLAKNTFGIPPGEHNVTNIPFMKYFMELQKTPAASWQEIHSRIGI